MNDQELILLSLAISYLILFVFFTFDEYRHRKIFEDRVKEHEEMMDRLVEEAKRIKRLNI